MSREGTSGRLWVVEMRQGRRWLPTVGVAQAQVSAFRVLNSWRAANPKDEFRLVIYQRAHQRRVREWE